MTIFARGTLNANQGVHAILFAFKYKNTFRLTQFASRPVTPVLSTATFGHTHVSVTGNICSGQCRNQESPPEHTPQFLQVKAAENAVRLQHAWVDPTAGSCRPLAVKGSL